jgi:hypothetical protein
MFDLPQPFNIGVNSNKHNITTDDIDWSFDTYNADMKMIDELINNHELQIDYIKLYPLEILPFTKIKEEYCKRLYIPYSEKDYRVYSPYVEKIIRFFFYIFNLTFIFGRAEVKKNKSVSYKLIETDTYIKFLGMYKVIFAYNKLEKVLLKFIRNVQPWVRINRVIRDFPTTYLSVKNNSTPDIENIMKNRNLTYQYIGNVNVNMRDDLQKIMDENGWKSMCIRAREVKDKIIDPNDIEIVERKYLASGQTEYFISFETKDRNTIIGFARLRLINTESFKETFFDELIGCAFIRELHVYGNLTGVNCEGIHIQHKGYGRRLVQRCIELSKNYGYSKIAVISGVGVRNYYRKFGFEVENQYMTLDI